MPGRDDTIPQDFGRDDIRCFRGHSSWIVNEVASNNNAGSMRLLLVWTDVTNITDVGRFVANRDLGFGNEEDAIRSFDIAETLGKTSKLIRTRLFPLWTGSWILDEMSIDHGGRW